MAGNCAYALAQLGILMIFARTLPPSDVGLYALALAITAPVQVGLGLRLRTVRAVDLSPTPFRTYLQLTVLLCILAAAISISVGAMVAPTGRFVAVVGLVALTKSVEGMIDVCYGEYQRQDRLNAIAVSQILRATQTVTLAALGVYVGGLIGALMTTSIGWLVQLLILDFRRTRAAKPLSTEEGRASSWALIRRSWPLGLAAGITSLSVSLPRFTVAGLLDTAALGVLAVLSYPTIAITLFANSLGQANVRRISLAVDSGDLRAVSSKLTTMVCATTAVGVGGVGIALVAGRHGVALVFGEAYAENFTLLLILLLAATLAGFATNAAYLVLSTGRFGLQLIVVCVTLGLSSAVIYAATQRYGLIGTGAALAFMYGLQAILTLGASAFVLRRARFSPEVSWQETR